MARASYLPQIWDNDEEMAGLMSLPKARRVNSHNYDRVVNFWKNCISDYCRAENTCVFSLDELKAKFRRGAQVPSPLETTLLELQSSGQAETKDSLARRKQGWAQWGFSFINPMAWLNSSILPQADLKEVEFVHMDALRRLANDLLRLHRQQCEENGDDSDHIVGYKELKAAASKMVDPRCFDLVLDELVSMGELGIGASKDGNKVLKFKESSAGGPVRLTDADVSVHELRTTMAKLDVDIKRLEQRSDKLKADALVAYRRGDKKTAINVVKRKKRIDKEITDKDIQYQRLLSMLEKIVQNKQTRELLDVYKESSNAFKATLARQGLTMSNVDNAMESVSDAMQDYEEITTAIREGLGNISASQGDSVDEDELETELRELLAEDKQKAEVGPSQVRIGKRVLDLDSLPEVPEGGITAASSSSRHNDLEERWKRIKTGVYS